MEAQPNDTEKKMSSSDPAKIAPIVFEDADENNVSYFANIFGFRKVGTFFGNCFGNIAAFSKSIVSKTWNGCQSAAQWIWRGIKTIPSYCVIRWDAGNDEDELDETAPTKSVAKIESVKEEPVKAAVKPVEGKTSETVVPTVVPLTDDKPTFSFVSLVSSVKSLCSSWLKFLPQKTQRTQKLHEGHDADLYDEDELASSRWWNIGIKTAAATAAALILAGGYFAVKPLLFNASTDVADIGIVEPTDQSHPAQNEMPPVVPAAPVPLVVAAEFPTPPLTQELGNAFPAAAPPPQQDALLDNSIFAVQTPPVAPVFSETAPPLTGGPFGAAVPNVVAEHAASPSLSALPPLAPLASSHGAAAQPQLQPLAALHASALPTSAVANAPIAVPATASAPIAANRGQRRAASPASSQAPVPPPVTPLPQTAIARPMVVAEPVREIVPQIPPSGIVQNVTPPVVAVTPTAIEPPAIRSMNEPVPAIPRDAPISGTSPVVVVPAAPIAAFSSPHNALSNIQPIDRQLWEQIELLRNAEAEPMQLRLDTATTTTEPALRFTPRNAAPTAIDDNLLAREVVNSFSGLTPADGLNPADIQRIETTLSALENAPQPVFAELAPAYRNNTANQSGQSSGKGGLTFQSRIHAEVTRSPSETETYTIRQGDTYMTISDQFYGTSLLYTALAAHNQQLGIGWRPAEGVVIEIPTAEFLRMHYGEAMTRQERRLEAQRSGVRYIVQEGDTVFRLATDRLQDSTRWREIYAMNADRLQDVRDLKPGMEILLPIETARRN